MLNYYLKETFHSIFQAKIASVVTVLVTFTAIIFVLISGMLIFFSNQIEETLKKSITANVFLKDIQNQDELNILIAKFSRRLDISDVKYIDKEKARENFIKETGEDFSKILEINPLPASLKVKFIPEKIDKSIIKNFNRHHKIEPLVDEIIFENTSIFQIIEYINSSRILIYFLAVFFQIFAIYLIYSTSLLIIQNKKEQYETMKLVGTKIRTIKIPLLLSNIFLSGISSLLAFSLLSLIYAFCKTLFKVPLYSISYQITVFILVIIIGQFFGYLGYKFSTEKISLKLNNM